MPRYKKERKNTTPSKIFNFIKNHIVVIFVVLVFAVGITATVLIMQREENRAPGDEGDISILQPATEVRIAMYNPRSFDPLSSSDEDVVFLNQLVYGYLFRLDENLNIVPDLVESYTANRETGSVEIQLKAARFSDGTELTAYDVEFTINTIRFFGSVSPYYNYISKLGDVYVTGTRSIYLSFLSSKDASLDNLVFPIVSADTYNSTSFAIGCGPYKYGEYIEGKSLDLDINQMYYGKIPEMPVNVHILQNKDILPGLATMDDITAYISSDNTADNIAIDRSLRCRYIPSGELEYLGFNCSSSFLSDTKMRQAISFAIDRNEIISDDYGNGAVISDSIYFPGFLGVDQDASISYDPKRASEILSSLGYVDLNEDKMLESPDGENMTLTLLVNANSGPRKDAAATIVKSLSAVGIRVEVQELSSNDLRLALKNGEFDMYLAGIDVDKQFNLSELFEAANFGKFRDDTLINLVSQLEQCLTADEQKAVFVALKPILNSQLPYLCICYKSHYFISVSTLSVESSPMFFDPYRNIGEWHWQKKVTVK